MRVSLPPAVATVVASAAAGIGIGVGFSASVHAWAASPLPTAWVLTASTAALAFAPAPGRWWSAVWGLGLVALAGAEYAAWGLGQWADVDQVANLFPMFLPIAVAAALNPAQPALRRAGAFHSLIGLAAGCFSADLPRPAALALLMLLTFAATQVDSQFLHWSPPQRRAPWWGAFGATAVFTSAICIAMIGRSRTDVSVFAIEVGIGAWIAGALWPTGRLATGLAAIGLLTAAWIATQWGESPSIWLVVGLPLACGAAVAGTVSHGRNFVSAGVVATLAVATLVVNAPETMLIRSLELARAAPISRPESLARALSPTPDAAAGSLVGPVALWHTRERTLVELDSHVLSATGRARDAERLAGVIAGCTTAGRARARVAGDDFGWVATALSEQGFSMIEAAAPDAKLPALLAAQNTEMRSLWLRSQVRLIAAPAPLAIWAGKPADALVFVTRRSFADGRSVPIDDWVVKASAFALRGGGTFVAAVPSLDSSSAALARAARAVGNHFPVASLWLPAAGAETAILVGSAAAIDADRLSSCAQRSRVWLASRGLQSATDLAGLAVADQAWMAKLPSNNPDKGMAALTPGEIALAGLDFSGATALSAFEPALHATLAPRQATSRAALTVFAASAKGDLELALRQAHALADQPGASQALEPLIRPILERARLTAAEAAKEGASSPKWATALASIDGALIIHPASAEAQCLRGEIFIERLQFDQAAGALSRCTELAPRNAASWDRLAQARHHLGDAAGAEAAARRAVSLAPDWWEATLHLGLLLSAKGSFDEAERWLRRSAQAADPLPDAGRSRPHLALATVHLRRGAFDLALAEAHLAESREPTATSAYLNGAALDGLGRTSEAESKFRLAVQRDPQYIEARHDLGVALANRGDYVQAADAFRRVLAAQPNHAAARQSLDKLTPMLRSLAPLPAPETP